ncbi:MAG: ABC transporter permease [Pseudomonadota bacterium]|nr:ABC transporter permease [Pseudomonadota bacterium]
MMRVGMFSCQRFFAVLGKEFIQMRRDRLTFGMMIGIPLIQVILFGYAINTNPRHMPAALLAADNGPFVRSIVAAMENTDYFDFTHIVRNEAELDLLIETGQVLFGVQFPPDFERKLVRGQRPAMLVTVDATDQVASAQALAAMTALPETALDADLKGTLAGLAQGPPPFETRIHRRYNPELVTQYNIVPGMIGVILTLTMVILTGIGMTREYERGTMENLLAMPVRPMEVMVGKILPFVVIGFVQVAIILVLGRLLYGIPLKCDPSLLTVAMLLFIAANLTVGFTFATLARNQLQVVQMSIFFFMPSLLLSGFMFPFRGMPDWAQWIGETLPLTHFIRIVRGVLLKNNGWIQTAPEMLPILAFMLVMGVVALLTYRQTLD